MTDSESRRTFFRQNGWMTFAVLAGGGFNMASNFIAQRMPPGQFNIFDTAMSAMAIAAIPALGMQASFAAQAAGADTDERRRELAATMRGALALLSIGWLALAGWCWVERASIMATYKLTQPAMLWVLLLNLLVTLLTPVAFGTLQGRQDFSWFGGALILNGVGRFLVLVVVVLGTTAGALGGMNGVLAGSLLVLGLVVWRAWDALALPAGPFPWRSWLRRLLPVTLGMGALTVLMQADAIVVREKLQPLLTADEVDGYSAVRKVGLALVFVIGALTSVMYPKLARSFQRAQQTDALKLTMLLTAGIGVGGAVLATLFPEIPMLLSPANLRGSKSLVPAYCWSLVPVALTNVLIWSLLARECYRAVPVLAILAGAYWLALQRFHDRPETVITVVGVFGVLFFVVCLAFTIFDRRPGPGLAPEAGKQG